MFESRRKKEGKTSKLIKINKLCSHYELLKYEYLGLKVKKIHKKIRFKQSLWLKDYIDFNTNEKNKRCSMFEKNLWKLIITSLMEKQWKMLEVE